MENYVTIANGEKLANSVEKLSIVDASCLLRPWQGLCISCFDNTDSSHNKCSL